MFRGGGGGGGGGYYVSKNKNEKLKRFIKNISEFKKNID